MRSELLAEAVIGRDAEEFLASDLGRMMVARAEEEYTDALEALRRVNPTDVEAITSLQNKAWRAESFRGWLAEIIITGKQALETLDAQE